MHLEKEFDFIWAFSVLIHLSDPVLNDLLSFVRVHLKRTGRFYANVNIGKKKDGYWDQGFPVVWRSIEFYERASLSSGLRVSDMGTIGSLGFESGQEKHDTKHMLEFSLA